MMAGPNDDGLKVSTFFIFLLSNAGYSPGRDRQVTTSILWLQFYMKVGIFIGIAASNASTADKLLIALESIRIKVIPVDHS
jgi:hypothetical protein